MALETEGSSETVSSGESTPVETTGSGYSVTDPGYEAMETEPVENELEALRAENTKAKPSATADDASKAEGDTEELDETPADDDSADEISDELIDRALELGYTAAELKEFPDAKALEKDVARAEKIQKRLAERTGKKPDESAPADEAEPEPKWDELIELGHDPDMIALQKTNWQRAQKAEALVQQLLQTEQNRALTAQAERFDEVLNKLEGFDKILGTGRKAELGKTEAANRQTVFTTMQILRRGYEEAGVKVPAEAELIQAAAMASFPKHTDQISRTKLKTDIKKAGSQALSRPRSAEGKPLAGPERASAKEADFWKKFS